MNKKGNPGTLVASHPGNTNAAKYGVHSPRLLQPRAAEIFSELTESFEFSPPQRLAAREVAQLTAILEAINCDLDERGLVDKCGEARSILNHRASVARQLERWLAKIAPAIERQSADETAEASRAAYMRELRWIALGNDSSASASARVAAIRELERMETPSTTGSGVAIIRIIRDDDGTENVVYEGEAPADEDPTSLIEA